MAKDKKPEVKNDERVYTIPLRRDTVKTARYKRTPKAIRLIKAFLEKHLKTKSISLSKELNQHVWAKGIKNPPGKVKVKTVKDETGNVLVSLEK